MIPHVLWCLPSPFDDSPRPLMIPLVLWLLKPFNDTLRSLRSCLARNVPRYRIPGIAISGDASMHAPDYEARQLVIDLQSTTQETLPLCWLPVFIQGQGVEDVVVAPVLQAYDALGLYQEPIDGVQKAVCACATSPRYIAGALFHDKFSLINGRGIN